MPEPQRVLLLGDACLCERALAARSLAICEEHRDAERHTAFSDELDLESLRIELRSQSLFVQSRHFVIRHAQAARDQKGLASLFREDLAPATYLTFLASELKESSPLAKAAKEMDALVSFPLSKGKALEGAASELLTEQGLSLAPAARRRLVKESGEDLLAIFQEAVKLRHFAPEGTIGEDVVERLCFTAGESSIYPFLDALGKGQLQTGAGHLSQLRDDPTRTFGSCVRHLARVLSARLLADEGIPLEGGAAALGVPAWLARRLLDQAKSWTAEGLTLVLDQAIELDRDIKAGHIRPADALLELVLCASSPETRPAPVCAARSRSSPEGAGTARTHRTGSPSRRSQG